ncbi:MAG: hypothetical protein QN716_07385, partial [Nitrososphaeraceae archaeon]|nr:hypothetical protein [Nitrososphaeraceae archaeon]
VVLLTRKFTDAWIQMFQDLDSLFIMSPASKNSARQFPEPLDYKLKIRESYKIYLSKFLNSSELFYTLTCKA